MRLNLKLLIAAICIMAGVVILWRSFGAPKERTRLFIPPTIQIVAEPAQRRPTLIVAQVTDTGSVLAEPRTKVASQQAITMLLRVEATETARAEISYSINGSRYNLGLQALPWSLLLNVEGAQPISVQARQIADGGTLRCSITLDAEVVPANKNESNDPLQLLECSVFGGER